MKGSLKIKFTTWVGQIPAPSRKIGLVCLYGICGSLVGIAFHHVIEFLFRWIWSPFRQMDLLHFILYSFPVLLGAGLMSGILMVFGASSAAGSGIPQLKLAFWKEHGVIPLRPLFVKFLAGSITVGGGMSLGREGPTVYIAGGLTSWIGRRMGVILSDQRLAMACGASAGLAAAFNTPIAAVTFVLEEVIEDLNSRFIGSILLASVVSVFCLYLFVGNTPVFIIPTVTQFHWQVYFLTVFVAAFAAMIGVQFQKISLGWRLYIKKTSRVPVFLRPVLGAMVTWFAASVVFGFTGRMGVLGLGYEDLAETLAGNLALSTVLGLLIAKLIATISCYSWGGCGGIFAPTLFFGAMVGALFGMAGQQVLPLHGDDVSILAVVGMTACLGAVVRAPITSILIVFEMTHHFEMVPPLMLGMLVSQAVSRLEGHQNFYTKVLEDDGEEMDRYIGVRDFQEWKERKLRDHMSFRPHCLHDWSMESIRSLVAQSSYAFYPVVDARGLLQGVISREDLIQYLKNQNHSGLREGTGISVEATLGDVQEKLLKSDSNFLVVTAPDSLLVLGVFTLHDLMRTQS
ncbi:MAG: chloride channel protein [Verrucomicrobiota bacterium]